MLERQRAQNYGVQYAKNCVNACEPEGEGEDKESSESPTDAKGCEARNECPAEYSSFLIMHLEVRESVAKAGHKLVGACRDCSVARTERPVLVSSPWPAQTSGTAARQLVRNTRDIPGRLVVHLMLAPQQAGDRKILINERPVNAAASANEPILGALFRCCIERSAR